MTNADEALEALRSLALRSESQDSVDELVAQVGYRHPGPPIVLVLTTTIDGRSSIQYRGDPAWAVAVLRSVAQGIEDGDII
jgi:hypothetical protein